MKAASIVVLALLAACGGSAVSPQPVSSCASAGGHCVLADFAGCASWAPDGAQDCPNDGATVGSACCLEEDGNGLPREAGLLEEAP